MFINQFIKKCLRWLIIVLVILFVVVKTLSSQDEPTDSSQTIKSSLSVEWLNAYFTPWELSTSADGRIMPWQEAKISTQTNGLIITRLHVNVGDKVKKGQVLAEFENETIKADLDQLTANVKEAEAYYDDAQRNYVRATHLQKTKSVSDKELHELKTTMLAMQSRLDHARASQINGEIRVKQTQLLAPDDGVISARHASIGVVANAGDELFKMIVQHRLEWQAEVAAHNLARLFIGQHVLVTLINGQQIKGKVRQISPIIDPIKNTAIIYVDLDENEFSRAGMFVKGVFIEKTETFLTLPQNAIIMSDGFYYVFKILDDSSVQRIKVAIHRRQNNQVAVVSGISEQDKLVASAVGFLKDGDIVNVISEYIVEGKK